MAAQLGADSLRYLPVASIARAIGFHADELCRACITGDYPTPAGQKLALVALEISAIRPPGGRMRRWAVEGRRLHAIASTPAAPGLDWMTENFSIHSRRRSSGLSGVRADGVSAFSDCRCASLIFSRRTP